MRIAGLLFLSLLLSLAPCFALTRGESVRGDFDRAASDYFDFDLSHHVVDATNLGIHKYDGLLPDWSGKALAQQEAELIAFRKRFLSLDPNALDRERQIDRQLALNNINSSLLDLQKIKPLQRRPAIYSEVACDGVLALIKRPFAPLNERLESAIKRMSLVPGLLSQAKENLKDAPKVCVEIALEELPGSINFFRNTVPEAFAEIKDPVDKARFTIVQKKAIAALQDYQTYLSKVLLPKAPEDFAIGKENYKEKLLDDEMVDTPLSQLLKQGYDELHRLQSEFKKVALQINPDKSPLETFKDISSKHPKPDELLPSVRNCLDSIVKFLQEKKIVTIPSQETLLVEATPEFERALSFASMDTAGPFEKVARQSYYYVTPAEAGWSKEKIEEHMRAFSTYDLINTSVHEAYPGHFVQFLWCLKTPSNLRKVLGANSNVEGWAHYCEEMMVKEGLDGGNPELNLIQLHDALLRACRYIVGISMHTQGMTIDQGINFFVQEGYMEKANAERETKRGTVDPTYLIYTLGKMEIKQLRADYQKAKGDKFSLREFHDQFLSQGYPPIKLVRMAILGN